MYGLLEAIALNPAAASLTTVYGDRPVRFPPSCRRLRQVFHPSVIQNRFAWDTIVLPRLAREDATLLFPNYFTPPTARRFRKVTVIHDLQYLHFPQYFSRTKRAWLRVAHEATLRLADVTIAISEFVRDDILSQYGAKHADRLTVLSPPIQWDVLTLRESSCRFAERLENVPYVLSVSAHWPHKNLTTLVRAFALVARLRPELKLVLVGQPFGGLVRAIQHGPTVESLVRSLGLEDRVLTTGYVENSEITWLYDNARMFVFPSLFEGMGRPAVEALGLQLPVLTTRCTAIPEVTQGLAVYVDDPLSPEEMAHYIVEISDFPDRYRPSESEAATIRAKFSAQAISGELLRLLGV